MSRTAKLLATAGLTALLSASALTAVAAPAGGTGVIGWDSYRTTAAGAPGIGWDSAPADQRVISWD